MYFNGSATSTLSGAAHGHRGGGRRARRRAMRCRAAPLLAFADQTAIRHWFNGDDALVLAPRRRGRRLVRPGRLRPGHRVGIRPGLHRRTTRCAALASVCVGDTDPSDAFDPATRVGRLRHRHVRRARIAHGRLRRREPGDPVINEFSASTAGDDVEYVELLAEPGADLSGYRVLEIEGDAAVRPSASSTRSSRSVRPMPTVGRSRRWRERARERHDVAPARRAGSPARSATTSTRTTTACSTCPPVSPSSTPIAVNDGGARRPDVRRRDARRRLRRPLRSRPAARRASPTAPTPTPPPTGCATTSTRPASPATPERSIGGRGPQHARCRERGRRDRGAARRGRLRGAGRDDRLGAGLRRRLPGRREPRSRSRASSSATSRPAGSTATTCRTRVTATPRPPTASSSTPRAGRDVAVGDEVHVVGDGQRVLRSDRGHGRRHRRLRQRRRAAGAGGRQHPGRLADARVARGHARHPAAGRSRSSSSSSSRAYGTIDLGTERQYHADRRLRRRARPSRSHSPRRTPRTGSRSTTVVPRRTPTRRSTPNGDGVHARPLVPRRRPADERHRCARLPLRRAQRPRRLGPLARAAHRGRRLHGREPPQRDPRARGRRHDEGVELQRAELLHDARLARRERPSGVRPAGGEDRLGDRRRSTPTSSASSRSRTTATPRSARSSTRSTSVSEPARTTSSPRACWAPT